MKKAMPIGFEDIRETIQKERYYVDKTLMIKELLDNGGKVNLFTRPRRFGKTLNQSMLRRFFELELDEAGNPVDNGALLENLKIASCGEKYLAHQGQYPVINLSLKSAKQPDYEMAYESLVDEIAYEYSRHDYVLKGEALSEEEKKRFCLLAARKAGAMENAKSIQFLSYCLAKYHKKNVMILIDEYDVPLENSYFGGFYDEMIAFIRSLFESSLKTNPYLEMAVITGCLRIGRESIFTGLNNLKIYSIQVAECAEAFGFTEGEVQEMLTYYNLEDNLAEIRKWYDGYLFGDTEIYNPWSIINYIGAKCQDSTAYPKPYWSNTSSNSIIRELVEEADFETRREIESLIAGETMEKPVHEDITYGDIHESRDNLWNYPFQTQKFVLFTKTLY